MAPYRARATSGRVLRVALYTATISLLVAVAYGDGGVRSSAAVSPLASAARAASGATGLPCHFATNAPFSPAHPDMCGWNHTGAAMLANQSMALVPYLPMSKARSGNSSYIYGGSTCGNQAVCTAEWTSPALSRSMLTTNPSEEEHCGIALWVYVPAGTDSASTVQVLSRAAAGGGNVSVLQSLTASQAVRDRWIPLTALLRNDTAHVSIRINVHGGKPGIAVDDLGYSCMLNGGFVLSNSLAGPSVPPSIVTNITGGAFGTKCGRSALTFSSSGSRYAVVGTPLRSVVRVNFTIGISTGGCEGADSGEDVFVEYSTNSSAWVQLTVLSHAIRSWQHISVAIPPEARVATGRLRWIQYRSSGRNFDEWALADLAIVQESLNTTCERGCSNRGVCAPTTGLCTCDSHYGHRDAACDACAAGYTISTGCFATFARPPSCPAACSNASLGDHVCSDGCDSAACAWDNGACAYTPTFPSCEFTAGTACNYTTSSPMLVSTSAGSSSSVGPRRGRLGSGDGFVIVPYQYYYDISVALTSPSFLHNGCNLVFAYNLFNNAGMNLTVMARVNQQPWRRVWSYEAATIQGWTFTSVPLPASAGDIVKLQWRVQGKHGSVGIDSIHYQCGTAEQVLFNEDFNTGSANTSFWESLKGGTVSSGHCTGINRSPALQFYGSAPRTATTKPLDLRGVSQVAFYVLMGNGGSFCDPPERGEDVTVEYSEDNAIWVPLVTVSANDPVYQKNFTRVVVQVTTSMHQAGIILRWRQKTFSGTNLDAWALDSIQLVYEDVNASCTSCGIHGTCSSSLGECLCDSSPSTGYWSGDSCQVCRNGYTDTTDCFATHPRPPSCDGVCTNQMLGSSACDAPCNNAPCHYDLGNCPVPPSLNFTSVLPACNFEASLCGWHDNYTEDAVWERHAGPTSTPGTGPSKDHTTGSAAGRYLYVEMTGLPYQAAADFVSPWFNSSNCNLEFFYHMYGSLVGQLSVDLNIPAIGWNSFVPIWVQSGNHQDQWRQAEVQLPHNQLMRVRFRAVRSTSDSSDIAIDDIGCKAVTPGGSGNVTLYADDFSSGSLGSLWSKVSSGIVSTGYCGSVNGFALQFISAGTREAVTKPLDLTHAQSIAFQIRIGGGGSQCENADNGEGVVLEFSENNGGSWSRLADFNTTGHMQYTYYDVPLPRLAHVHDGILRWRQLGNSGSNYDEWALDDIEIFGEARSNPCPNKCNGNGVCTSAGGVCSCFHDDAHGYWSGADCSSCANGYAPSTGCRGHGDGGGGGPDSAVIAAAVIAGIVGAVVAVLVYRRCQHRRSRVPSRERVRGTVGVEGSELASIRYLDEAQEEYETSAPPVQRTQNTHVRSIVIQEMI